MIRWQRNNLTLIELFRFVFQWQIRFSISPVRDLPMTVNLERAIATAKALPPEQQDDMARIMMLFAGEETDEAIAELSADEEAALQIGVEQADRGQFATDEQMKAIRAKYGVPKYGV